MVYVFFVQPGDMMTFDNEISIMQTVGDLKKKVTEKCKIAQEQQVLLINGGEPLDAQRNLCSYMAGTDTNPIYLFSTNYDVSKLDILRNLNYDDSNLKQKLLDCLELPACLATVKTRALVAQDYFSVAKAQMEFCENMVHDQHLQQQGWSAVIANLEDIVSEFRKKWELFLNMYRSFIADRDTYDNFLLSFEEDKKILQKIPVIDTLLESQKELMDGSKISETTTSTSETEPPKEINLYEWISSSDTKNSLDELYVLCKSNLNKFEKEIMPSLEKQVNDTLMSAEKPERKEIEGLGKRLFDLDELLRKIKKNVEYQSDMAQSFLQNQNSVAHLNDTSILPDLCSTHIQQMEYIKQCHQKLMDDRNRIVKAKYELSKSLCARIGWVQNVEDKLWELDSLMVYFHEHLQRLRKHLEVFQQLHLAPITYMNAVVEVVRRRSFSQIFLLWASDLACQQLTIHNEEVARRKEFNSQFEGHFLNALFPGMGDVPPPFAIESPSMFDVKLPQISEEDVEKLRREVPDFAEHLLLPDLSHVVSFFMGKPSAKSKEDKVDDATAVEEKLIQAVSDVGLASNSDKNLLKGTGSETCLVSATGLPNLKDDKGCESETDTEEFEKVGQSPLELTFPQGVVGGAVPKVAEKQDASTSTEDNLQISRSEHDKLKALFLNLSTIAKQATANLRTDLNEFKAQFANESRALCQQYEDLGNSWDNILLEVDRNEKEIVESMKRANDGEKEQFRYNLLEKEDVIRRLDEDKRAMEDRIQDTCKQLTSLEDKLAKQNTESTHRVEDLLRQLHDKDLDKEKSLKELSENLKIEHKAELDNIKSRFKFMTMERSPSLSSLEKEKSGDFTSLANTNAQVQRAILEEKNKWEKILEEKTRDLQKRFEEEKHQLCQDIAKRVSEDKDKQIDVLREREKNLNLEIIKYKTTIQQLADYQEENRESDVNERLETLKREKEELQHELSRVKSEMLSSGTLLEDARASSSTAHMAKSEMVTSQARSLNIDSCRKGDIVLVLWDQVHENFRVLQESRHTYFLHSDSLNELGLTIFEGVPNKTHRTGEVVDKEFCQIRKSDNRFKVAKGTTFFLVKVKPIVPMSRNPSLKRDVSGDRPIENLEEVDVIEELIPTSIEKQFAEDSGIVDSAEPATAATEDCDRYKVDDDRYWSYQDQSPLHKIRSLEKSEKESEKIETLQREKEQLYLKLQKLESEKEALMSTSVALCEGKLDATTSPLEVSSSAFDLSKSEITSNRIPRLHIDSCKPDDIVLLLWDPAHENFKILQDSKHTYFLHSDCLDKLGLTISDGKPNKTHCIAQVVDKEYCQTRKSENRYKVPKGTKFFRVKVKPIAPLHRDSSSSTKPTFPMSSSQSVITTFDPLIEESQNVISEQQIKTSERRERLDSEENQIVDEELQNTRRRLVEDSGIEEATVATESSNRCEGDACREVIEQSTYVSTNWLGAMFRSMFSK